MPEPVISIKGLHKSYGNFEAVRGIDLTVERGQIFAVLGPNGAGKTTTVEILEGYRDRDAGDIDVLGSDPADPPRSWRELIGIVPQETALEPYLTVRESLELYAGYYESPGDIDQVIGLIGLEEKAGDRAGKLSGGQQRRLDVGIALVGDPELLFLDEPTTGFDPSARRHAWEMIAGLRDLGKTVLLTTHYMEEAQFLADRVAIINRGRIIAEDTPQNLGGREDQPARITFRVRGETDIKPLEALPGLDFDSPGVGGLRDAVLETTDPVEDVNRITGAAIDAGIELIGLEVRRPTLEDVYLEMTEA